MKGGRGRDGEREGMKDGKGREEEGGMKEGRE